MNIFWLVATIFILFLFLGTEQTPAQRSKTTEDFDILSGQGAIYPLESPNLLGNEGSYSLC